LAETRYVTDQFEITMRSGESTRHKILRLLPSGSAVELVSTNPDTSYSKIRLEDGATGYVLSRQLLEQPVARDRIAGLQARLEELQQEPDQLAAKLSELQSQYAALESNHESLRAEKARLEEELATIRHASANVVRITQERAELRQNSADLSRQLANLQQENLDLRNQSNQRWFLIGAGVVLGGILIGLILPHLRLRRRRSSWGSL
jgi:SH3 domain protein